jgi:hypothetical protein
MMVERYPNLKEEVGNSISSCEISSLLDRKLARWSTTSCALVLACRLFVSIKRTNKLRENFTVGIELPTTSLKNGYPSTIT